MLGSKIKLKTGAAIGAGSAGSLKTASAISATLQTVTDNAGNNSALQLANNAIGFSPSGTSIGFINASGLVIGGVVVTQNGAITIKGLGGNILNLRNSVNVQVANIDNNGGLTAASLTSVGNIGLGSGTNNFINVSDGVMRLTNAAVNNYTRLILGTNDTSGVSIAKSGTNMRFSLGNDSALTSIFSKDYTSDNLTAGTLTTARPVRFGDRASITEAGFVALNLTRQIAIEHNGIVYYIPASLALIP